MTHLLLPHELNKRHKTEDFEHLRITHKFYTFKSGRAIPRIGSMVDSYGRYWFQGMDAQAEIYLAKSLASKGFERTDN